MDEMGVSVRRVPLGDLERGIRPLGTLRIRRRMTVSVEYLSLWEVC